MKFTSIASKTLFILLPSILIFSSCSLVRSPMNIGGSKSLNQPRIKHLKSFDKRLVYIRSTHIAKKRFYDNIKKEIAKYKEQGYVLYYENIDIRGLSTINITKLKKMMGYLPNRSGYEQKYGLSRSGLEIQNPGDLRGLLDDKDYNVDFTAKQIIENYEKRYGEIILYGANSSNNKEKHKTLPKRKVNKILWKYRKIYLAHRIEHSQDDSIVLVFASNYYRGIKRELKRENRSWKKKKKEKKQKESQLSRERRKYLESQEIKQEQREMKESGESTSTSRRAKKIAKQKTRLEAKEIKQKKRSSNEYYNDDF